MWSAYVVSWEDVCWKVEHSRRQWSLQTVWEPVQSSWVGSLCSLSVYSETIKFSSWSSRCRCAFFIPYSVEVTITNCHIDKHIKKFEKNFKMLRWTGEKVWRQGRDGVCSRMTMSNIHKPLPHTHLNTLGYFCTELHWISLSASAMLKHFYPIIGNFSKHNTTLFC